MIDNRGSITAIPRELESYPSAADQTLAGELVMRVQVEPFNALATVVFLLAILHTFAAARVAALARVVQQRHDEEARVQGRPSSPSLGAEVLHFLGEVEVVFGLWAVILLAATTAYAGWDAAKHYVNDSVNYTEPLLVVVIMALASTRPVIGFAESALRRVGRAGGATPAAWWVTILTIGPVLGSLITEPAAMTICALLLARQVYDLRPSARLKYATLGVLFVNVSIGGSGGAHAAASSTMGGGRPCSVAFIAWTVFNAHYPAIFLGGFLFFLGFARATAVYQSRIELKTPLLVGFFLAGLVIHGGLQGWWIAPVLSRLPENPLFLAATALTAVNDNALITYLATLVPNLGDELKLAVVEGAVVGGGLTVIANAPNPAGQALLGRFFDGAISPLALFAAAIVPTLIAAFVFGSCETAPRAGLGGDPVPSDRVVISGEPD